MPAITHRFAFYCGLPGAAHDAARAAEQIPFENIHDRIEALPAGLWEEARDALEVLVRNGQCAVMDGRVSLVGAACAAPISEPLLDALLTMHALKVIDLDHGRFGIVFGDRTLQTDFAGFITFHAADTRHDEALPIGTTPARIFDKLEQARLLAPRGQPKNRCSALHLAVGRADAGPWVHELVARGFDPLREGSADPLDVGRVSSLTLALKDARTTDETLAALLAPLSLEAFMAQPRAALREALEHCLRSKCPAWSQWLAQAINHPACAGKLRQRLLKTLGSLAVESDLRISPELMHALLGAPSAEASAQRLLAMAAGGLRDHPDRSLDHLGRLVSQGLRTLARSHPESEEVLADFVLHQIFDQALRKGFHQLAIKLLSSGMVERFNGKSVPLTPDLFSDAIVCATVPQALLDTMCEAVRQHGVCMQAPHPSRAVQRLSFAQGRAALHLCVLMLTLRSEGWVNNVSRLRFLLWIAEAVIQSLGFLLALNEVSRGQATHQHLFSGFNISLMATLALLIVDPMLMFVGARFGQRILRAHGLLANLQ